MARPRLTGVLLVGGASRRFGTPKPLARLDGETLAERAWRILGAACDERIAVGKVADGLRLPFPLVDDGIEARLPAAGVVAGLRAARTDVCVFLPVDCPLVGAEEVRALGSGCAGVDAAVPDNGDPLPAAYARTALPSLERRLAERASLRGALVELDVRTVAIDPARLVNVNTPEELAAVERASV